MKKLIITLTMVTGMMLTSYAQASSFTSQTFGNTTYHSGGGLNGTSQTFGNTTYHNGTPMAVVILDRLKLSVINFP